VEYSNNYKAKKKNETLGQDRIEERKGRWIGRRGFEDEVAQMVRRKFLRAPGLDGGVGHELPLYERALQGKRSMKMGLRGDLGDSASREAVIT
jgi:hypothetical protein